MDSRGLLIKVGWGQVLGKAGAEEEELRNVILQQATVPRTQSLEMSAAFFFGLARPESSN